MSSLSCTKESVPFAFSSACLSCFYFGQGAFVPFSLYCWSPASFWSIQFLHLIKKKKKKEVGKMLHQLNALHVVYCCCVLSPLADSSCHLLVILFHVGVFLLMACWSFWFPLSEAVLLVWFCCMACVASSHAHRLSCIGSGSWAPDSSFSCSCFLLVGLLLAILGVRL